VGAVIGFVIGYVWGTMRGRQGYEELQESWKTLTTSEEMREIAAGGLAVLRDLLERGRVVLAERLAPERKGELRKLEQVA
jgi:hypothetical protein